MASKVERTSGQDRAQRMMRINGREIALTDSTPQGDQILAAGGFEPVDEHVLIQRMSPGSKVISLDQQVTVRRGEIPVFYAFRGGDVHLFTLDSHGYQWGAPEISEEEARDIGQVRPELSIALERDDQAPLDIEPGMRIRLKPGGVEHLRTRSRQVEVFLDGEAMLIDRGKYSTEELSARLGVEAGYLLNLKRKNGLDPLKPGQYLTIRGGMEFFSQAPGGASS